MHGSSVALARRMAGPPSGLAISLGQCSVAGAKGVNQDFHGSLVPSGPLLTAKGAAIAIADGISSSPVGARASEIAVKSFLSDYYCTPDVWSVKTAAERVIRAANSWLHAQNGRVLTDEERDRGHICTFSALILKSRTAHVFHVGDGLVLRVADGTIEPLTEQHRIRVAAGESYLARALGADRSMEIDHCALPLKPGDTFLLMTDGLHDHVAPAEILEILDRHVLELDSAAGALVQRAIDRGSKDDITVQIVRIDSVEQATADDGSGTGDALVPAPLLKAGQEFEGFEVLCPIHEGSRSHVYLARDLASGDKVALKVPSTELAESTASLRQLLLEEWIARRIDSPYVLQAAGAERARRHAFTAMQYVDGISLAQWMRDNPHPDLETVRRMVEQIARGLHAFHRREMLHRDLRPQNILIDQNGVVKIIDFGSAWVAGVAESGLGSGVEEMLGTLQYSAPEYLLGQGGDQRGDIFSLGVICYQMLTGALPFGTRRIDRSARGALRKLRYIPARSLNPALPDWIDCSIAKAVQPDVNRRYEVLSEFVHDLRHPNPYLGALDPKPLLQRDAMINLKILLALMLAAVAALAWHDLYQSRALDAAEKTISALKSGDDAPN